MKTALPLYAPLPTPEEMRRWDEDALALFGIPPLLLMENAAQAAFTVLRELHSLPPGCNILIIMGRGNNGGDGAALARLLHDEGYDVLVCCSGQKDKLSGPAREHADMAQRLGVTFLAVENSLDLPPAWQSPDIVIDALTGTGIKGDLRAKELSLVRAVNALSNKAFIFSLDIPSGLCGLSGKPKPEAVRAHATVCFEAGKPGLYAPEAREYTGPVFVRRVGIPKAVRRQNPPSWLLLQPQKGGWAVPPALQHKGTAGKVLIIGGSKGMAGAPLLAAFGCLRAGAGLVHAALPADLEPAARSLCPELLVHPIGSGSLWHTEDSETLLALVRSIRPEAVLIGPGLGRSAATRHIVNALLQEPDRPPVIADADALFYFRQAFASDNNKEQRGTPPRPQAAFDEPPPLPLDLFTENDILTPHPGEMARMLPRSFFPDEDANAPQDMAARIKKLQQDRAGALQVFTASCKAVLTLKGPGTLISGPDAPVVLSPFAVSTLAVGGSGDVLAGICAAVTASGVLPLDAAALAVYLHGRAGELLSRQALRGHLARDIADAVPLAWNELCAL